MPTRKLIGIIKHDTAKSRLASSSGILPAYMDPSGLSCRRVLQYRQPFEPEAPALQGRCSTRLSYRPIYENKKRSVCRSQVKIFFQIFQPKKIVFNIPVGY